MAKRPGSTATAPTGARHNGSGSKNIAPKARDFTNKRAYKTSPLSEADKATNRRKSSVRAKVEHPFLIIKRLWGFAKVRYRGLAKNANRAFAMLAMVNLSQMGTTADGRGAPGVSKIQRNSPVSALERTDYPMKMGFPLRFRLDFSLSPIFAVACLAFPLRGTIPGIRIQHEIIATLNRAGPLAEKLGEPRPCTQRQ
jgi:hypothetical protein